MKLYARAESERGKAGKGGNKQLIVELLAEDADKERQVIARAAMIHKGDRVVLRWEPSATLRLLDNEAQACLAELEPGVPRCERYELRLDPPSADLPEPRRGRATCPRCGERLPHLCKLG